MFIWLQLKGQVYFLLSLIVGSDESWSANYPFWQEKDLVCCRQLWLALAECTLAVLLQNYLGLVRKWN